MKLLTTTLFSLIVLSSRDCSSMTGHKKAAPYKITGRTYLHSAAAGGDIEACALLIRRYHTIDVQDSTGNTPLHLAASEGHFDVCAFLIDQGANRSAQNSARKTPYALRSKVLPTSLRIALAELLLPRGTLSSDEEDSSSEELFDDLP